MRRELGFRSLSQSNRGCVGVSAAVYANAEPGLGKLAEKV